jgi:hypothetical protein
MNLQDVFPCGCKRWKEGKTTFIEPCGNKDCRNYLSMMAAGKNKGNSQIATLEPVTHEPKQVSRTEIVLRQPEEVTEKKVVVTQEASKEEIESTPNFPSKVSYAGFYEEDELREEAKENQQISVRVVNDQDMKDLAKLERLIKIMRGQEDPRMHVTVITNPNLDHLISSSRLTESQVESIVHCKLMASLYPEFEPLGDFADTVMKAEISGAEGWGTQKGIELAEAYAPRLASLEHTEVHAQKDHWWNRKPKMREEPTRADR